MDDPADQRPDARRERARRLIEALAELPPAELQETLDTLLSEDAESYRRVHDLLLVDAQWSVAAPKTPQTVAQRAASAGPGPRNRLGPYELVRTLGVGGQARVYLAVDTRNSERVALKVLSARHGFDEKTLARFWREAEVASRLNHPAICRVLDTGLKRGIAFIAMQYVEGITLSERITRSTESRTELRTGTCIELPESEALEIHDDAADPPRARRGPSTRREMNHLLLFIEKVARALHEPHEAGLVHRDIKPANIMVTTRGEPVIVDFGLASCTDGAARSLTHTGDLLGTPQYMSPEQLLGKMVDLDRRSDIYSLGVTLYECLTLRRPFEEQNRQALYQQILAQAPPNPRSYNPAIPKDLKVVLDVALDKDRKRRYRTALEFADDLRCVRKREAIGARPISPGLRLRRWMQRHPAYATATAGILLLLIALGTWAANRESEPLQLLSLDPAEGKTVGRKVLVTGLASQNLRRAEINDLPAELDGSRFTQEVLLAEGCRQIVVRLESSDGHVVTKTVDIDVDRKAPTIDGISPPADEAVGESIEFVLKASEALSAATVNGTRIAVEGAVMRKTIAVPRLGLQLVVRLEDRVGNESSEYRYAYARDTQAPQLLDLAYEDGTEVTITPVIIAGRSDELLGRVSVNGTAIEPSGRLFVAEVQLSPGLNTIDIVAHDLHGNSGHHALNLVYTVGDSLEGLAFHPPSGSFAAEGTLEVRCSSEAPLGFVRAAGIVFRPQSDERAVLVKLSVGDEDRSYPILVVDANGNRSRIDYQVKYRPAFRGTHDLIFMPPSGSAVSEPQVRVRISASDQIREVTIDGKPARARGGFFEADLVVIENERFMVEVRDAWGNSSSIPYALTLEGGPEAQAETRIAEPMILGGTLPARIETIKELATPLAAQCAAAFKLRGQHRNDPDKGSSGRPAAKAVAAGLDWLAAHQSEDGRWDCDYFMVAGDPDLGPLCDGKGSALHDVGVSGLALLAFLGAGHTHREGAYQKTLRQGLRWLRTQQDSDGCFGPRVDQHFTYNHAAAAAAMTQAYGMTRSGVWKRSAQKAIDFVVGAQNFYKAWRYDYQPGDNDMSVTGWMVMALASARMADLDVDPTRIQWAHDFCKEMTDESTGRTGYTRRGTRPDRAAGRFEQFPVDESESLTAVGVLTRIFCGENPEESLMIKAGTHLIMNRLPAWEPNTGKVDMVYWYFGTLSMFQVGANTWAAWGRRMRPAIIDSQRTDGNFVGSWDPLGPWGEDGGRIYSTSLMIMCLEAEHFYTRIFPEGR